MALMRTADKLLIVLALVLLPALLLLPTLAAQSDSAHDREHELKAAVIYKFVRYAEWPKSKFADGNEIVVGLLTAYPFANAFDPVKGRPIKNRKLVIKELGTFSQLEKLLDPNEPSKEVKALRQCHLLFICDSEKEHIGEILKAVEDCNVLTVGESENFIEAGGIINFIPEAEKPDFEVNLIAAKRAGLQISSKVLRLAQKVITEESPNDKKERLSQ
jgi:hypothetical protein